MASITRGTNGRRTIQFIGTDGKRRSIRLGKLSQRAGETVSWHVEHLAAAKITGHAIPDETARWMASLDGVLADRLAQASLIPRRESVTPEAFLDAYIGERQDVKKGTRLHWNSVRRNLLLFFGGVDPCGTSCQATPIGSGYG